MSTLKAEEYMIYSDPGEKIAVFDVCDTLYMSNTTYDFIDYYLQSKSLYQLLLFRICRSRPLIPLWVLLGHLYDMDIFRKFAVRLLHGAEEQYIRIKASCFVSEVLFRRENASALALMKRLQKEGYTIVLASASLLFVVEEVASVLSVSEYFACSLESRNGLLTGRYLHDIRGRKDCVIARRFPNCIDLVVVTDNREDINLILKASHAWIVCDQRRRWRWSNVISQHVTFLE
jgi:HAD superfamily phosphoserine phosphatase-like hydrolase